MLKYLVDSKYCFIFVLNQITMARQVKNIQLDNYTELRITNKYGGCDIPVLVQTRGNGFEVHYNGKMKVFTF